MKQIITIIAVVVASTLFAQIGKVPVVTHNGVKCYEHTVEKKQTAYGISRMYKVDINQLYELNPTAQSGLSIGQKIYLPLPESEQTTVVVPQTRGESIQQEGLAANENQLVHTVQKGETLWSIARKYGVNPKDVTDANLEKGNNLSIGDQIIIPISDAVKKDETTPIVDVPVNPLENPEDSIILHKVKKGETMYGIANQYGVTQQAILAANDNLVDGLKKGMKIRIPLKRKVILKPRIEEVIVADTNKVDSIVELITADSRQEQVYDVAILLPFELAENARRMAKCPPFGECLTYANTFRALNFHHGMLLAIDSLKQAGVNLNVRVYDTKADTATVNKILRKAEFKEVDLIIGPIYVKEIKIVTKYAKRNKIQMVCPVPVSNKALFQNPYVSKLTASKYTQVEYLARYIAEHHHQENIILVRNKYNKTDEVYFQLFKKLYAKEVVKYDARSSDSVKVAIGVGKSSKLIYVQQHMVADKKNIIVDLSTNLGHVSNLITKLTTTMNSNPYNRYEIALFGMEDWQTFETVDEKYKNRYNLSIVAPGFLDFKSPESIAFIQKYRAKYGTDPDKFSFIGFDAAFTNIKGLFLYGTEYAKYYDQLKTKGYYNTSDYHSAEEGSGFENKNVSIIEYNNYHLRKVN
ncbi:MAG: LysM peptidoglycan-binding domain-containing protein [Flavobacteriales bacterium]|jgi:LysM repeat protein/ABC-type branched-subunit amino acid transport system substrate-binding protein|nr:LysM peptidoglycan-binding domain-containing protein [Flavobacteriales bacterium]